MKVSRSAGGLSTPPQQVDKRLDSVIDAWLKCLLPSGSKEAHGRGTKPHPDDISLSLTHTLSLPLSLSLSLSLCVCVCVCVSSCWLEHSHSGPMDFIGPNQGHRWAALSRHSPHNQRCVTHLQKPGGQHRTTSFPQAMLWKGCCLEEWRHTGLALRQTLKTHESMHIQQDKIGPQPAKTPDFRGTAM